MNKFKVDKKYVSELDKFLQAFDQKQQKKSKSQLHEIAKHQRLAKLRDEAADDESESQLWDKF